MKRLKCWTASIVSGFDSVINKVENHEAVVNTSIRELQEAAARAKVKLARFKAEVAAMKAKRTDLETSREKWNERALSLRETDKAKAIECLRRRKRAEAELERITAEIPRHQSLLKNIEADVSRLEERIEELRRKKLAFSSRASRAKALELTNNTEFQNPDDIEDIFERWEIKLTESEIGANIKSDSLEDEFLREEEQFDLERELEELDEKPKA